MPKSEPNPDGLMAAVRGALTKEPTFTQADGTVVRMAEVPEETRVQLQAQVEAFVNQIASSRDLAVRFDEAVRSEDKGAVTQIIRESGVSKDFEIKIDEIDPDARITFRVCWVFGLICQTITVAW